MISLKNASSLNASSSEEEFASIVDEIRSASRKRPDLLLELLSERHPVFKNRTANTVNRMRGYAIAALEITGMPNVALPYVLEALESSFHPYMVAASARAVRGMRTPDPQIANFLVKAIFNISQADKPISFVSYNVEWPLKEFTTALTEIFQTLGWMGSYARNAVPELEYLSNNFGSNLSERSSKELNDALSTIQQDSRQINSGCCELPMISQNLKAAQGERIHDLLLEDQEGNVMRWDAFFTGKLSVVAFFYTRCANPRKCTLTIYNIVDIQQELERAGLANKVKTAAITYDPSFDASRVLLSYGEARRFQFGEDHKMFRTVKDLDRLVQAFGLSVNFTGTIVNEHRIELFILDAEGKILRSYLRLQTEPYMIIEEIKRILSGRNPVAGEKREPAKHHATNIFSFVLPVMVAFFPKCPVCWASYISLFGLASIGTIPYSPWLATIILTLSLVNLIFFYRAAKKRNGIIPFLFSLFGSAFLLFIYFSGPSGWSVIPGISMLVIGSLLNAMSLRRFNGMKLHFIDLWF